ncbi:MAG: glycine dehydrogenase (aminomethyl-transferring), partial [Candidatus Nanopelagicaceae bacterium]
MLHELGYSDLESFTADVLPNSIKLNEVFGTNLPAPLSETQVIAELREIAKLNQVNNSLIGMGYYGTVTPPVILRNVLENPSWYTAYTPYQPEISQGRLEALFAFQTMVSDLTGLAISNASMLDEATAAAEAMTLARRVSKKTDDAVFIIDKNCHPQNSAVITTRAKPLGIEVVENILGEVSDETLERSFALLIQYPDTYGRALDLDQLIARAKARDVIVIVATDLLALTLIKTPGEMGADIAVGSAQRFGVPMGFGGPHAGFMSVKEGFERALPGR